MSTRRSFNGNIVILGLGSIGCGVIPLLFQNLKIQPQQVLVIASSADRSGADRRLFQHETSAHAAIERSAAVARRHAIADGFRCIDGRAQRRLRIAT